MNALASSHDGVTNRVEKPARSRTQIERTNEPVNDCGFGPERLKAASMQERKLPLRCTYDSPIHSSTTNGATSQKDDYTI
jgi:hypothetical protein